MDKNRIEWIDELKGFILICICLSHMPFIKTTLLQTCVSISTAFSVPTFFFISGLLFNPTKYPTFTSYLTNKFKSLLLPYLYLSFFFLLLSPQLYSNIQIDISIYKDEYNLLNFFNVPGLITTWYQYLYYQSINIIFAGNSGANTTPLWFVLALFFVSTQFYIVQKQLKGHRFLIFLFCLLCLFIGWLCSKNNIVLPWKYAVVFTASFFYSLGFLFKNFILSRLRGNNILHYFVIIFIFLIYFYCININGAMSPFHNAFGGSLLSFVASTITGITLVITLFKVLEQYKNRTLNFILSVFHYIAKNAIVILAVHFWIINCIIKYFNSNISNPQYSYIFLLATLLLTYIFIPIFRNKLYFLIGKNKITFIQGFYIKSNKQ